MSDRDLSDRLSPILVKELRQGVKAQLFAGALILLHLLMVLAVLAGLAMRSMPGSGAATSALFWTLVCFPLLVLMPASGLRSISGEMSAKTLDLVLLTRLTAYRIVLGKWAAIVVETLLLVSTIFPYVVLRYFLGRIDLWSELLGLLAALVASAFFSAVATTLSALRISIWLKWGIVALAAYLTLMQAWNVLRIGAFGGSLPDVPGAVFWVALVAYGALVVLILLETGAVAIAPFSENHSSRIRVLAVVLTGAGALLTRLLSDSTLIVTVEVVTTAILFSVCATALCEPIRNVPSLYAPFFGRSPAWRLAGPLLAPGWPSGALFTIAACAGWALAFEWPLGNAGMLRVLSLIGSLMLPLAVMKSFPRLFARFHRTLPAYLVLMMAMGVPDYLYFLGKILNRSMITALAESAAAFLPLSYFALNLMPSMAGEWAGWEHAVQVAVDLAAVLVVCLHARRGWSEIARVASGGTGSPAAPAASPSDLAILDLRDRA